VDASFVLQYILSTTWLARLAGTFRILFTQCPKLSGVHTVCCTASMELPWLKTARSWKWVTASDWFFLYLTILFRLPRFCSVKWYDDLQMMNLEECGKKLPLPKFYRGICLKGLKKTTKNISMESWHPGWDLNPGSSVKAGVLTTQQRHSVGLYLVNRWNFATTPLHSLMTVIYFQWCLYLQSTGNWPQP